MEKLKIALLSAFIGAPGKEELKITQTCLEKMKGYGVDIFLYNGNNIDLLKEHVEPELVLRNEDIGKTSFFKSIKDYFRFYQSQYPSSEVTHNRLLAKIPKMQFYKLIGEGYDYYIWLDSKFTLLDSWMDYIFDLIEKNGDHALQVCYHSERSNIREEYDYMRYHIKHKSEIVSSRYVLKDMYYQIQKYFSDPAFVDNKLFEAGFLLYSKKILLHKDFLDEWYAHNYYYTIQDQLSLPYLLNKYNIDVCPLKQSVFDLPGTKYGYND